MNAGNIVDVLKTRFKKLSRYYHNLPEDYEENDIHCFRLEIKKLRAFVRLINMLSAQHHQKISRDLKSFYKLTGTIRNLQLHQLLIGRLSDDFLWKAPAMYLQYLHDEEKALRRQAKQMAGNFSCKDFQNKLITQVPLRLTKEAERDFIQKNKVRLYEVLSLAFYTDEALHEIRKILKDLIYNFNYISADIKATCFDLQELKAMEEMASTLGDFHDLCVGLSLLSSIYVTEIATTDETKVLNELRFQLQLRKDVMKAGIIELLKQSEPGPNGQVAFRMIDNHK